MVKKMNDIMKSLRLRLSFMTKSLGLNYIDQDTRMDYERKVQDIKDQIKILTKKD